MKAFDIQKEFLNDIIGEENLNNKNKYIYHDLVYFRFYEVLKNSLPIYFEYIKEENFTILVKEFISYGAKTTYVWKIIFEFYEFLLKTKKIPKIQKQILIFEIQQIKIYASSNRLKAKKYSTKRYYRLNPNIFLQIHNFDIVNQTFENINQTYYLIYKNIDDFDVYYLEISKFLYYFLKYQKANNNINKAIKLASKRANINYNDALSVSKMVINNFINSTILI